MKTPSDKQIGQKVEVDFSKAGTLYGKIVAVKFTESQVLYDICLTLSKGQETVIENIQAAFVHNQNYNSDKLAVKTPNNQ